MCLTRILLAIELELEMNKKFIAEIRKQFKMDTDLLEITDIYNIYIKKESSVEFSYIKNSSLIYNYFVGFRSDCGCIKAFNYKPKRENYFKNGSRNI